MVLNEQADFEKRKRENLMEVLNFTNTSGFLIIIFLIILAFIRGATATHKRFMFIALWEIVVAIVKYSLPRG